MKSLLQVLAVCCLVSPALADKPYLVESFDSPESIVENGGAVKPPNSSTVFEPGLVGNAIRLNGNQYVSYYLNNFADFNRGGLEFYFKPYSESMHGLVNLYANENNLMAFRGTKAWLEILTGGSYQYVTDNTTMTGRWHHVAMNWETGKDDYFYASLYLDGKPAYRKEGWRGLPNGIEFLAPLVLSIGTSFYYGSEEAAYDDLRVYRKGVPAGVIQRRVRLLNMDPERKIIDLVSPSDGAVISNWTDTVVAFGWQGLQGLYNVQLSTDTNFSKATTIDVKSKPYFGKPKKWIMDDLFAYLSIEELQTLLAKTGYQGNDFYWRIKQMAGAPTTAVRAMQIIYEAPVPEILPSTLSEGDVLTEGHTVTWTADKAIDSRLEICAQEDFSGKIILANAFSKTKSQTISRELIHKLNNLSGSDISNPWYLRVNARDVREDSVYSDSIQFFLAQ